ncbi:flagellar biosynthetic protein FliO [Burkholderia sp. L27(2015)]|uniref:flagellar biosynthetic protein FliO n=1 Tax=Burkholderia sp. L27(2015) TaxID=1641858 RepID=UPI0020B13A91|nr:flagellar biosynthetic protein FliO [Burkholderia sp. L27(2015)]
MTRFKYAGGWLRFACGVGLSVSTWAMSAAVLAAEPRAASGTLVTPAVGAGTALPSLGVGGMLQGMLGLVAVLAMVFGCAWFARRFGMQAKGPRGVVKIVGGVMLTQKERVVVVEVAGTWLVLGVAPGQVSTLHTVPAGSAEVGATGSPGGNILFSNRLRDSLAKRFGSPIERASSAAGAGSERETR